MAEQEKSKESSQKKPAGSLREDLKSRLDEIETLSKEPRSSGARKPSWKEISTPPQLADMAMAARQMSTLLDASIPLLQSLRILAERSQHPHLKRVFSDVAKRVEQGETLSNALAAHPRIFSRLFVGVAKIGESAGILDRSIRRLADILEQRLVIRRQVRAALAYPVIALCVAFIVLMLVFGFAIPKFAEIYESEGVALPWITQVILGISLFIKGYFWLYIPLLIALVIFYMIWKATPPGRLLLDTIRLRTPVLGAINQKIQTARILRTLANLLEAGVPLLETLSLTSSTAENIHVSRAIDRVHNNVEKGGKIEPPLRESNVFPALAVDMIAIGDEAGSLEPMLNTVARNYETEVESTLRGISSIIEPVLILFLGSIVLVIALGALLPYFNLIGVLAEE